MSPFFSGASHLELCFACSPHVCERSYMPGKSLSFRRLATPIFFLLDLIPLHVHFYPFFIHWVVQTFVLASRLGQRFEVLHNELFRIFSPVFPADSGSSDVFSS